MSTQPYTVASYTPMADQTTRTVTLNFELSGLEPRSAWWWSLGCRYRPERLRVRFRREAHAPWFLAACSLSGPRILTNGRDGEPVTVNPFGTGHRIQAVRAHRTADQETFDIPDVVYEILEAYWPLVGGALDDLAAPTKKKAK